MIAVIDTCFLKGGHLDCDLVRSHIVQQLADGRIKFIVPTIVDVEYRHQLAGNQDQLHRYTKLRRDLAVIELDTDASEEDRHAYAKAGKKPYRDTKDDSARGHNDARIWFTCLTAAHRFGLPVALLTKNINDFADATGSELHPDCTKYAALMGLQGWWIRLVTDESRLAFLTDPLGGRCSPVWSRSTPPSSRLFRLLWDRRESLRMRLVDAVVQSQSRSPGQFRQISAPNSTFQAKISRAKDIEWIHQPFVSQARENVQGIPQLSCQITARVLERITARRIRGWDVASSPYIETDGREFSIELERDCTFWWTCQIAGETGNFDVDCSHWQCEMSGSEQQVRSITPL